MATKKILSLAVIFAATFAFAQGRIDRLDVDNIRLDGNTISTRDSNGNLNITPNGTGKLIYSPGTATTVPYLDADKKLQSSAVTPTELGYLTGVTSAIQTQLDSKSSSAALSAHEADTTSIHGIVDTSALVTLGGAQSITGVKTLASPILTTPSTDVMTFDGQASTPSSPSAGFYKIYVKDSTGKPVILNSSGTESALGGSGGSAGINVLADYNPKAEESTTHWSETGGGTLSTTASTIGNVFSYDPSADNDYARSSYATVPETIYGANCMVEFYYKGFDTNMTYWVGTSGGDAITQPVTLTAQTGFRLVQQNFPCPSSGNMGLIFEATGNGAIGYWDEVHLGTATNVGSGAIATEWTSFTPTGSLSTNTTYSGFWRRVGDSMEVYTRLQFSGDPGTYSSVTVNIPSGYTVDTNKLPAGGSVTPLGNALFTKNSDTWNGVITLNSATAVTISYIREKNSSGAGIDIANLSDTLPSGADFANGNVIHLSYKVPITNWPASIAINSNTQPWRVDANISGANPDMGTSDITSYTGIENGSLTLTNNTGSGVLTAQIPCSSTNASSGTTCSAGSESIGVVFTIPRAGDARACATFAHYIGTGAGGAVGATFQIVETPNIAQTISQEGKEKVFSAFNTASSAASHPIRVCGTFTFSAAGQKTLRLMREQDTTATVSSNLIIGDAEAITGQRDIHWEVYPIDQQFPAPVLVGSVTSNSTGAERIERARITGHATTPTVSSQSGSWISSITRNSTGDYTLNLTSGIFSAAPSCTMNIVESSAISTTAYVVTKIRSTSTSAVRTTTWFGSNATATANDYDYDIICMGPR